MWLSGGLSAVSVTVMNLSLSCSQTAVAVACLVSGGREASGIAHEVPSLLPSVLSPFMPSCISIQVPFLDEVERPDMSGHKVKQRHQPISPLLLLLRGPALTGFSTVFLKPGTSYSEQERN